MLKVNSLLTGLFRTYLSEFTEISNCLFRIFLLSSLLAGLGVAQESSASLNGTVRDITGAVIPGAHITLRNTKSGVEQTTISTDTGRYVFVTVSPGEYTVSNSTSGYAPVTQGPFTLVVNQTGTFDFSLQPGTLSQRSLSSRPCLRSIPRHLPSETRSRPGRWTSFRSMAGSSPNCLL